jgi:TonB family protein
VKQAPTEARGRTPTRGAQVAPGNSIAETGSAGPGLRVVDREAGPAPAHPSRLSATSAVPDTSRRWSIAIRGAWNQNQGSRGVSFVKFTIQRDGRLTDYIVEKPSGSTPLDLAALRAVAVTKSLPPLPNEYPNPTLVVHLSFEYK